MRKSKKAEVLANKRESLGKNPGDTISKSSEIPLNKGTSRHIKAQDLGQVITAAKETIKANGLFPTTDRIAEETGFPRGIIAGYFESRIHNDVPRPLLRGMMYQGPLSHEPYYGPIQVNNKGDWRPRGVIELRVASF